MRRRLLLASLLLIGTGSLVGCGQKGPLFLPPTKPAVTPPVPATSAPSPAPAITAAPPVTARSG